MSICEKSVLEFGMDAHAAYMHVNTPQSYPFRCHGKRDSDGEMKSVREGVRDRGKEVAPKKSDKFRRL